MQQHFEHLNMCKVARYQHRNTSVRHDHAWSFTHHVWVMNIYKCTYNQKWKLQQKSIPNTILKTGVKSRSTSGLLWSASPETVTSSSHSGEGWQLRGSRSRKQAPHVLQLRNTLGNLFTINTNRNLGICKSSMIFKASDLVC